MRAAVVDDGRVREFDYESTNKRRITGNIYLAKVVRAEPSLQAVFVEYGGNRHGFLAFSEIHPHYYNIPVADRTPEDTEADGGDGQEGNAPGMADSEGDAGGRPDEPQDGTQADGPGTEGVADGELPEQTGLQSRNVVLEDQEEPPEHLEADPRSGADDETDSAAVSGEEQGESGARAEVRDEIRRHRALQRKYKVQEVIRQKQLLLVQVIKDERGNKGAALTTYISLAGRYCVLMPNTDRGGGISRKITNVTDRRKLKKIASEIEVPEGVGLIIRTAGANRTKQEIKRDYEYLIRQWDQIRQLTFKSIAPAKIFEDGGLIRRAIRDDYTKGIDEVVVDGEDGYKTAKSFMKMIMPSHAKKVRKHAGKVPLFASHGIEQFLSDLFEPVVQLPSGGYIVIGITEALVAIDVNSGKATRHGTLEQTALQTNLEAAEVIADQLRLRDLAGLIVIDFIDMEENKHNAAVEKCLKERLKADRSKIQVERITNFGLLEMSRQRLRPGLLELSSQPCAACRGTGMVRAEESVALEVLRRIEIKAANVRKGNVLATVPVAIANIILNAKRATLAHIEEAHSVGVLVEGHPDFKGNNVEIKQVAASAPETGAPQDKVISVESSFQDQGDEEDESGHAEETPKRRRRSSRGKARRAAKHRGAGEGQGEMEQPLQEGRQESGAGDQREGGGAETERRSRRSRRRSSSRGAKRKAAAAEGREAAEEVIDLPQDAVDRETEQPKEETAAAEPARRRRRGSSKRGGDGGRSDDSPVQASAAATDGDNDAGTRSAADPEAERPKEETTAAKPARRRRRGSSRSGGDAAKSADAPVQNSAAASGGDGDVGTRPDADRAAAQPEKDVGNRDRSSARVEPDGAETRVPPSGPDSGSEDGKAQERRIGWWSPEFQSQQGVD